MRNRNLNDERAFVWAVAGAVRAWLAVRDSGGREAPPHTPPPRTHTHTHTHKILPPFVREEESGRIWTRILSGSRNKQDAPQQEDSLRLGYFRLCMLVMVVVADEAISSASPPT
jgi:hypothetical protein